LLDDLFHAQPDSLFILVGLILIVVGVVGSIKTYIDPGKTGRIAALSIGTVLVIVGFVLYAKQPAGGSTAAATATPAAATTPAATTPAAAAATPADWSTVCHFSDGPLAGATHELPRAKPQPIGNPCHDLKGNRGQIVAANTPVTP